MKVHVDTDFGGDPDDAAALAMLLGWPDVEVVGVTTNLEVDGQRAGCAAHYLRLAAREDVPVAAGASTTLSGERYAPTWGDDRYWPTPVEPMVSSPGAALELLARSVTSGASVLAIGALTNLALVEVVRPGSLDDVRVVVMGGRIDPPPSGFPQWGPEMDFNLQSDTQAAEVTFRCGADVTLVPLATAITAQLRSSDLARLRETGPIGELLARQSLAHGEDTDMETLAARHPGLAADLVNFHWDPVAAAVASDWSGATIIKQSLRCVRDDTMLRLERAGDGRPMNVTTAINADRFGSEWLHSVADAHKH